MKARGVVERGEFPDGWRACIKWTPEDSGMIKALPEWTETATYSTIAEARKTAESYATALGLEVEWKGTR